MSLMHPAQQASFLATAGETHTTVKTFTAAGCIGTQHTRALVEVCDGSRNFVHDRYEFVAHHPSIIKTRFPSMVNMKIRATNACQTYFHDSVTRIYNNRVGHIAEVNLFYSPESECLHNN